MRHGEPRGADGWQERLVDRLAPFGVSRLDDRAAAREADVVDQNVETAERLDGFADDLRDSRFGGNVGPNR